MLKQTRRLRIAFADRHGKHVRAQHRFIAVLAIILITLLAAQPAAAYPSAGSDEFDSSATIVMDLTMSGGPVLQATVVGPTIVKRGAPYDPGDGHTTVDIELISLSLVGASPIGSLTVRESPYRASTGQVRQKIPGTDFPADSFFDMFVEIETPMGVFVNNDPIRLQAEIDALPPFQAEYKPPTVIGVALYTRTGRQVGVITHASHFVGQKPSFSVAPGGPSGLNAGTIFDVPTAPRITPTGLGLVKTDDLDALSYGTDYVNHNTSMRFSVDPSAAGVAGSAVAAEAAAGEAHGDEFRVKPSFPIGGSNAQVLDENGSSAPPFPLLISDDVDALTEPPASFVDPDGNGIPDAPVYFSLAKGSPSLTTIPASPADILSSTLGAKPTIVITETALGLVPGDDVDAFCFDVRTGRILFSLAPGSPTLAAIPANPGDLFGGAAPPFTSPPPVYAPEWTLGLLETDDLNALKCTLPEVDYFGHTLAELTILAGPLTETVTLGGPTTVFVAVGPEGAAQDTDADGRDQVQTEIVHMELGGISSMGPIIVRLPDPQSNHYWPSYGEIEETTNHTPGTLDLSPFTSPSDTTADSFFDVFVEVEVGGQVYHTLQPKRMQTVITHKPPNKRETYTNTTVLDLYNENGQPTGISIGDAHHTPNPPLLVHDFLAVEAELTLSGTQVVSVPLAGWATILDFTDQTGQAGDMDGNGLDQVPTEIVQLDLRGTSSLGEVSVRLRDRSLVPCQPSLGQIEERVNNTPGILDVSPYAADTAADSFFDVFVEVSIDGSLLYATEANGAVSHNDLPLRLEGEVSQAPPAEGETFYSQNTVALNDETGVPTGMTIVGFEFTPESPRLRIYLPLILRDSP